MRKVSGYTDLGRVRVPPLPRFTVFEDRDGSGTLWALTHEDGVDRIAINDALVGTRKDFVTFGAFNEPITDTRPAVRLFVRGGILGYEVETLDPGVTDRDYGRLLTRRDVQKKVFEIVVPATFDGSDRQSGGDDTGMLAFNEVVF